MANVLAKIVEDKRDEVAKRKQEMPLESFIDGLTPSKKAVSYTHLTLPTKRIV